MKKIKIILTFILLGTFSFLFVNVKAQEQPNEHLLNIKVLQYEYQTSDTATVLFNTRVGNIDDLTVLHDNMQSYFDTNVVYFLPEQKGNYLLLNSNYNTFRTINDFDYLEIDGLNITFYKDTLIIYSTSLLNVYAMIWEWDGIWVQDYNNGYRDATIVFNERLEALITDYENKIDMIITYYRTLGYDEGRGDGASESEAYKLGYRDGANNSFLATLKDWIVPAIIVVIILGGFITVIHKRKDGEV